MVMPGRRTFGGQDMETVMTGNRIGRATFIRFCQESFIARVKTFETCLRNEARIKADSQIIRPSLVSFSFHFNYEFLRRLWHLLCGRDTMQKKQKHTFSCRSCAKEFQALAREVLLIQHSLFVGILHFELINIHQPSWQVGNDLVVKRGRSLVRNKGHAYLVTFTVDVSDQMCRLIVHSSLRLGVPRLTFQ